MSESKLKIVFIDDDLDLLNWIGSKFNDDNIEALCYDNAKLAVQDIREGGFDIVVIDLDLPEDDGFIVVESIRKYNKEIAIYMMSSHNSYAVIEYSKEVGVLEFFQKPLDFKFMREVFSKDFLSHHKKEMA